MLTNYYWYMPDALTEQETQHIDIEGEAKLKVVSLDGHHQGDNAERSSKITWLYDETTTHLLEETVYSKLRRCVVI